MSSDVLGRRGLAVAVAAGAGLSQQQADNAIQALIDAVARAAAAGQDVALANFGSFVTRIHGPERRRVVVFHVADRLAAAVRSGDTTVALRRCQRRRH